MAKAYGPRSSEDPAERGLAHGGDDRQAAPLPQTPARAPIIVIPGRGFGQKGFGCRGRGGEGLAAEGPADLTWPRIEWVADSHARAAGYHGLHRGPRGADRRAAPRSRPGPQPF